MSIEDRLRKSMNRVTPGTAPSERAWTSIEDAVERRRRRTNVIRITAGAIVVAAFVGGVTWAGLALHGRHEGRHGAGTKLGSSPQDTLVVSDVKMYQSSEQGPGGAKLSGTVTNNGSDPTGADITCTLDDANGRTVASASASVDYVAPQSSEPFGAAAEYQTAPATAACTAEPRPAVTPQPKEPPPPTFQLSGAAFFDADHGIAAGSFGTPGCENGCTGRIEATADGGKTWTEVDDTRYPIVSVTVLGSSDAWAVEDDPCAFSCPALLHSSDGGATWTDLGEVNVINPTFVSPAVGFAVAYERDGINSPLVSTTDGGRTWHDVSRPCGTDTYSSWGEFPAFVSPTHGWILCDHQPSAGQQARTLYETTDGGTTWNTTAGDLGTNGYPQAVFFQPDGTGWIGISMGKTALSIVKTGDGGQHWGPPTVMVPDGYQIHSLSYLDDATGYAVISVTGSGGDRLIETTDGGSTWTTVHTWEAGH